MGQNIDNMRVYAVNLCCSGNSFSNYTCVLKLPYIVLRMIGMLRIVIHGSKPPLLLSMESGNLLGK